MVSELEKVRTVGHRHVGGRKYIQLLTAEIFDDTDARFFPADIFFYERRTVRIQYVTEEVGQFEKGGRESYADGCSLLRRLYHIRRAELRKYEVRHFSRGKRIVKGK